METLVNIPAICAMFAPPRDKIENIKNGLLDSLKKMTSVALILLLGHHHTQSRLTWSILLWFIWDATIVHFGKLHICDHAVWFGFQQGCKILSRILSLFPRFRGNVIDRLWGKFVHASRVKVALNIHEVFQYSPPPPTHTHKHTHAHVFLFPFRLFRLFKRGWTSLWALPSLKFTSIFDVNSWNEPENLNTTFHSPRCELSARQ